MNYTRDPIIETVITPREGCKLIVRSSRTTEMEEEYSVDALEIVSFGSALFFRSQERPRPFLLPATDYEVVEGKEARMVLKKAQVEKNIKIGGGKKVAPPPPPPPAPPAAPKAAEESKTKKRRSRRRRGEEREEASSTQDAAPALEMNRSIPRPLLPPPSSLISEHLSRYKNFRITEAEQEETAEVFEEVAPMQPVIPLEEEDFDQETHLDEFHLKEEELDTTTDPTLFIDDEILKND